MIAYIDAEIVSQSPKEQKCVSCCFPNILHDKNPVLKINLDDAIDKYYAARDQGDKIEKFVIRIKPCEGNILSVPFEFKLEELIKF